MVAWSLVLPGLQDSAGPWLRSHRSRCYFSRCPTQAPGKRRMGGLRGPAAAQEGWAPVSGCRKPTQRPTGVNCPPRCRARCRLATSSLVLPTPYEVGTALPHSTDTEARAPPHLSLFTPI